MSLIEEALRKQREETEKNEKPAPPPPPEPAPETPPEPEQEQEAAARRPWAMLAGLILLGILGIAFIVWLLVFGLQLWQTTPPPAVAPQGAAVTTNATPAPAPTPPAVAVPATNATPVVAPAAPATNIVVVPPPAPQPPAASTSQPVAVQSTPGPQPTGPAAPAVKPPSVAAPAVTPAAPKIAMPVMWPKMAVTGIIGSSRGGHSAVIINGQMLSPGDTLEGVRIETIEKQRVKLSYQGEVKMLSVGGTTE